MNTKSSTEAELVGTSDYLPNTMWVKRFLTAQDFDILDENYLEQSISTIGMNESNGRKKTFQSRTESCHAQQRNGNFLKFRPPISFDMPAVKRV